MTTRTLDALEVVRGRLQPLLADSLPSRFGESTLWTLQENLRYARREDLGLAEECLLRGCDLMIEYLRRGGAPGRPESLFQGLCCHVLNGLLDDWYRSQVAELMRLLAGEGESSAWAGDRRVLDEVHQAIERLAPPFREFVNLVYSEALPEDVVCERVGLADHQDFLSLSRLSLAALREEIERRLRA